MPKGSYHQGLWVQSGGMTLLSYNRGPGGAARQATALGQEGITVENGSLGELSISFGTYGWFPTRLPSEGADDDELDEV